MTEIRTVVDLHHPPGRVWRALTERRLLPQSLATNHLEPRAGARFQLRPVDLPGLGAMIDGELVSVDEPHRMAMRWQENGRRSLVVCELTPTPEGCRLSFGQSSEGGEWEPADRDRRQQTLDDFLTGRLPAVLDWLAFREVDLDDTVVIPAVDGAPVGPDTGTDDRRARRRRLVATTLAACLLTAIVVTVMGVLRPASDHAAGAAVPAATPPLPAAAPTTEPAPSAPPLTNHADPIRSTSRPAPHPTKPTAAATIAPASAALGAHYSTVSNRLFGYSAEVVVSNPSRLTVPGWVLTITLSGRSQVYAVSGASYHQNGQTVTFTGAPIPPSGSAHVRFDVAGDARLGDKRPGGCAVDGQPCNGL